MNATRKHGSGSRRGSALLLSGVLLASGGALAHGGDGSEATPEGAELDVERVLGHLRALQAVADRSDGTRASGTAGYDRSVDYVVSRLERWGYGVERQPFEFPFFLEQSPPLVEQLSPVEVVYPPNDPAGVFGLTHSASGDVSGVVQGVDLLLPPAVEPNASTSGCEPEDFAAFVPGNIALVQRGTCGFVDKASLAEAAGAIGVIVFNEGQPGRTEAIGGTLGAPTVAIPVVGLSFELGAELAAQLDPVVHIALDNLSETRITENVIADTACGDVEQTIVVGAHLDSVAEGPGINDNGSGVATVLEIARQLAAPGCDRCALASRVRFAFWGAEELGVLGSEHYVASAAPEELARIALNLNFDMLGSPNFVRFVYDGDGSETELAGPPGSEQIEAVFADYFAARALPIAATALDGRSDYAPFLDLGIPVGGLFSGAEEVKTDEQAALFGGTAGVPLDPCYHEACDTIGDDTSSNISQQALADLGGAALHAVLTLASRSQPIASEPLGPGAP